MLTGVQMFGAVVLAWALAMVLLSFAARDWPWKWL